MYESKLLLNRQKIFNSLDIYTALASYFDNKTAGSNNDFIYRLEWYKIGVVVPIVMYSSTKPPMKNFPECQLYETRLLPDLVENSACEFQLFAVPDFSKKWDTTDEKPIINWLQTRLKGAATITNHRFGPNNCVYYNQDGNEYNQQTVTIKGTLSVDNPVKLHEIRKKPIGLAAHLGCGLLAIAIDNSLTQTA